MDNLINKVIGSYHVDELIGTGGMGSVYKGRHTSLDRLVAIKVINPNLMSNPDAINRFYKEAKLHAKLQHINVVTVYDFLEFENNYFLIMEYVKGVSIDKLIAENGPIEVRTALSIFKQMLSGIEYAHSQGVIHRDIKTSNFLLTPTVVKITDFGISKLVTDSTKTVVKAGTPNYMSPEQIMGQHIDYRSDIYSLSVAFYEMLTGNTPFSCEDNSEYEIKKGHMEKDPVSMSDINRDIPRELDQIILKGLSKMPQTRHQSAADYLNELEKFTSRSQKNKINTLDLYEDKNAKNINLENVSFDFKGQIAENPYHKILLNIYRNKETGFLHIDSEFKLNIYFENGTISSISGLVEDLSLAEILVRRSKITEEDQKKALNFSLETGLKIGECLIAMNKITPHELSLLLEEQIKQKLQKGFQLRDGVFAFKRLDELRLGIRYKIYPLQVIYDYIMYASNEDIDHDLWNYKMNSLYRVCDTIEQDLKNLVFTSSKHIKILDYLKTGNRLIDLVLDIPFEKTIKFNFLHFLIVSELINVINEFDESGVISRLENTGNNTANKTLILEDEIELPFKTLLLDDEMQLSSEKTKLLSEDEQTDLISRADKH